MANPAAPSPHLTPTPTAEPHVLVWPAAQVAGWPPVDPTSATEAPDLPCTPLRLALAQTWPGLKPHASAAVLHTPGAEPYAPHPRLNKGAETLLAADAREHPNDPPTVVEARAIFIDVDLHTPKGAKRKWLPNEAQQTLDALAAEAHDDADHILHGAYLYSTPHGWRAVYALARPVPPHLYLPFARAFLRTLASEGIDADPACHPTIGRGYALPLPTAHRAHSPAWAPHSPPHAFSALFLDPTPYVRAGARSGPHSAPHRPLNPALAGTLASLTRPNPPPAPLGALPPTEERKALSRAFTLAGLRPQWRALLFGKPAYRAHDRNTATFRFAALAVEALADHEHARGKPLDTPEPLKHIATLAYQTIEPSLAAAFHAGVSSTPLEQARAELWRMVVKQTAREPARERAAPPPQDVVAPEARLALARARQSPPTSVPSYATPDTAPQAPPPTLKAPAEAPHPSAPHDAPLLVVHGSVFFVRDARPTADDDRGGDDAPLRFYGGTRNANAATIRLQQGTGALSEPAVIRGQAANGGRGAPRAWRQIEVDYGFVVDDVVTDHGRTHAELIPWPAPPGTRPTLALPGVRLAPVQAQHDPDIERWLDAIAGYDDTEALRAWLATAHLLHMPTAALYLQGDPRVGKGLFVNALRTLWAAPGEPGPAPVRFGEAMSRFNAGLERSPIVLLNEHIKHSSGRPPKDEEVTARFRDFIGNLEHRVEAKNQPLREVRGCPRLVITANDNRALPLGGMESEQALSAITERLRHFDVHPNAAAVVAELGGHAGVKAWVEGRAFARHVAHLRQEYAAGAYNHVEGVGGTRYLVEGVRKSYHERLVLQGTRLDVLEAVALALVSGRVGAAQAGVHAEHGGVVVDPGALADRWNALTGNFKPKRALVTRALNSLQGSTEVRRNKRRMRLVPASWVRKAARVASVGTDETIMRALLAPLAPDDAPDDAPAKTGNKKMDSVSTGT